MFAQGFTGAVALKCIIGILLALSRFAIIVGITEKAVVMYQILTSHSYNEISLETGKENRYNQIKYRSCLFTGCLNLNGLIRFLNGRPSILNYVSLIFIRKELLFCDNKMLSWFLFGHVSCFIKYLSFFFLGAFVAVNSSLTSFYESLGTVENSFT